MDHVDLRGENFVYRIDGVPQKFLMAQLIIEGRQWKEQRENK